MVNNCCLNRLSGGLFPQQRIQWLCHIYLIVILASFLVTSTLAALALKLHDYSRLDVAE